MATTVCSNCPKTIHTDNWFYPCCSADCQKEYDARRARHGNGGTATAGTAVGF